MLIFHEIDFSKSSSRLLKSRICSLLLVKLIICIHFLWFFIDISNLRSWISFQNMLNFSDASLCRDTRNRRSSQRRMCPRQTRQNLQPDLDSMRGRGTTSWVWNSICTRRQPRKSSDPSIRLDLRFISTCISSIRMSFCRSQSRRYPHCRITSTPSLCLTLLPLVFLQLARLFR